MSNTKNHKIIITNISYPDIVNLHFQEKNIPKDPSYIDENVSTLIQDDTDPFKERAMYFFDAKKNKIKIWPVMFNSAECGNILPLSTTNPCRQCHYKFITYPLGCPIKYYPHILNDEDPKKIQIINFLKEHNFPTTSTEYFETEHLFCSFPCVKAYIISNLSKNAMSSKYSNSLSYLTIMFKKLNGIEGIPPYIPPSHAIETLQNYGGHLNIEEYRSSIGIMEYEVTINNMKPIMYGNSVLVEELQIKK
jgi:hypothetical protein